MTYITVRRYNRPPALRSEQQGGNHEPRVRTTYVWVDYLAKVSPDEWKKPVGVGTSVDWPCGEGAKGNEGVSGRVKATPGAIGYIELIYALQNDIKFGAVHNKEKVAVTADLKSITAAGDNALTDIPEDLRFSITDAPGKDSYPICGTSWAVVYTRQRGDSGEQLTHFLFWALGDGQEQADLLFYLRLPAPLGQRALAQLAKVKVGQAP